MTNMFSDSYQLFLALFAVAFCPGHLKYSTILLFVTGFKTRAIVISKF